MLHAVSVEVIWAVSCPALMNMVALGVMPQYMTEPDVKLLPFTVNGNVEPGIIVLFGERLVMVGAAPPPMELDGLV